MPTKLVIVDCYIGLEEVDGARCAQKLQSIALAIMLFLVEQRGQRHIEKLSDLLQAATGDAVLPLLVLLHLLERDTDRLAYLPAYSPDVNPIEQAFSKLKALLRTAAARTVPDLWAAIARAFAAYTPAQCRNYITAAGYDAYDPT